MRSHLDQRFQTAGGNSALETPAQVQTSTEAMKWKTRERVEGRGNGAASCQLRSRERGFKHVCLGVDSMVMSDSFIPVSSNRMF